MQSAVEKWTGGQLDSGTDGRTDGWKRFGGVGVQKSERSYNKRMKICLRRAPSDFTYRYMYI